MRAVAYTRVSTREQAEDGHGLDAQRTKIEDEVTQRGWELVAVCTDEGLSAASMTGRNELVRAIRMIEAGEADVLVATKIDRLSRSVADFAKLVKQANDHSWQLVVLDIGLDLTTSAGKFVAHIMSAVAELERDMIAERTKDGLAAARSKGVRLGAPVGIPDVVTERIMRLRDGGATLTDIADELNVDAVPTARGGKKWHASTVRGVVTRVSSTHDLALT